MDVRGGGQVKMGSRSLEGKGRRFYAMDRLVASNVDAGYVFWRCSELGAKSAVPVSTSSKTESKGQREWGPEAPIDTERDGDSMRQVSAWNWTCRSVLCWDVLRWGWTRVKGEGVLADSLRGRKLSLAGDGFSCLCKVIR